MVVKPVPAAVGQISDGYPAGMLDALSDGWQSVVRWWGGVELWLTQLWLPVQVTVLMAVLLPVCWWAAKGIDRGVDLASERLGRQADADDGAGER